MTKKGPFFAPQNVRKGRRAKMGLPSTLIIDVGSSVSGNHKSATWSVVGKRPWCHFAKQCPWSILRLRQGHENHETHWIDGMSGRSTIASGCKLQFLFKSVTANWSDYVGLLLPTVGLSLRDSASNSDKKRTTSGWLW